MNAKQTEINKLKLAFELIDKNEVNRSPFISRRDNKKLYSIQCEIEQIIKRIENGYQNN